MDCEVIDLIQKEGTREIYIRDRKQFGTQRRYGKKGKQRRLRWRSGCLSCTAQASNKETWRNILSRPFCGAIPTIGRGEHVQGAKKHDSVLEPHSFTHCYGSETYICLSPLVMLVMLVLTGGNRWS